MSDQHGLDSPANGRDGVDWYMNEVDVRQRLVAALEADLIGPFVQDDHPQGGQEVLPLAPSRWYLTGFLAPQGGRDPDVDDKDSEDGGLEQGDDRQTDDSGASEPEAKRRARFRRFRSFIRRRAGQAVAAR